MNLSLHSLALLLLVGSVAVPRAHASACPALEGAYACKDASGQPARDYQIREVTDENRPGQTGYYLGDFDVVWAGPDGAGNPEFFRGTCEGRALTVSFASSNGGFYRYELTSDDDLTISYGQTSRPEQIRQFFCTRK